MDSAGYQADFIFVSLLRFLGSKSLKKWLVAKLRTSTSSKEDRQGDAAPRFIFISLSLVPAFLLSLLKLPLCFFSIFFKQFILSFLF